MWLRSLRSSLGEDLNHAANRVCPIEYARRAFDYFDTIHFSREEMCKIKTAPRFVDRYSVDYDAGVTGFPTPNEERG